MIGTRGPDPSTDEPTHPSDAPGSTDREHQRAHRRYATPVPFTAEELARIDYNADGLVPAIVQDASRRRRADDRLDEPRALRRTLETGRTWFWSRSRQEYWCKGETSGDRQWVRSVHYDCDGDALLVVVDQEGAGRLPHRQPHLLLPRLRRRPGRRRDRRHRPRGVRTGPGDGFRALAAKHRSCRCGASWWPTPSPRWPPSSRSWRRRPDRLPARVGRGRRALGPLLVRRAATRWPRSWPAGPTVTHRGDLDLDAVTGGRVSGDRGVLAALEALLDTYRSPDLADLPPLHGGLVGYLGYDVVREVEHLPDVPPDDLGHPDAILAVIGQLAAFDHWRQRVVLIDNVVVDPTLGRRRSSTPPTTPPWPGSTSWPPTASDRSTEPPRPLPERGRRARRRRAAPCPTALYQDAVRVAKEYITAGDIFQVVLSQRFDLATSDADPFDVYRVLRLVNPSPYLYFLRFPEVHRGRVVARADGAAARRHGDLPAHRRDPAAGATPSEDDAGSRPSWSRTRRSWPSTSCWSTWPATTSAGWSRFGTETVDELMIVERYSHVMHLTSQVSGPPGPGQGPDRRAAGHPAGRHALRGAQGAGHGDHRRARADQAGRLRRRGRLPRLLRQPRHGHRHPHHDGRPRRTGPRCRPGPASWPTAIPAARTPSAPTRRPPCWRRWPWPGPRRPATQADRP